MCNFLVNSQNNDSDDRPLLITKSAKNMFAAEYGFGASAALKGISPSTAVFTIRCPQLAGRGESIYAMLCNSN